jgi:U2 small nuclear ribonucleoprotein B''
MEDTEAPPGLTASTVVAPSVPDNPPNNTVYLNNLNERIKVDDLKRVLYTLCTAYGPVLDIVAMKTLRTRG